MKILVAILVLSLAATARAGEQKIVESETGIVVELTGSATSPPPSEAATPAGAASYDTDTKARSLAAQITDLRREVSELLQLTGKETPEEVALKNRLAEDKRAQLDAYVQELNRLTGKEQKAAEASDREAKQPAWVTNSRAERKQQIRELKMLRMTSPSGN